MSLTQIFGTAATGLGVTQDALRLVASNIANARTPGYARERAAPEPIVLGGQGAGMRLGRTERVADARLEALARTAGGASAGAAATDGWLDRLQAAFGTPGAADTLPARLDAIAAAALRLSSAGGRAEREALLGTVRETIGGFQALAAEARDLGADAADDVAATARQINGLLTRVADLNGAIAQATQAGRASSGLENRRASALDELGGLLAITVRPQPSGALHVETASGLPLVEREARQLVVPQSSGGVPLPGYEAIELLASSTTGAPLPTGQVLDGSNAGGRLGALLKLRDATLPGFSAELGSLFEGVALALNAASNEGTAAPPPPLLEGRVTGLAGDDALRMTGRVTLLLGDSVGRVTARLALDYDAAGAPSTPDELVAAINAALGPVASFADGQLRLANPGGGVALAADAGIPAERAGIGFAHFFGLNDMVRGVDPPGGLAAADPHGATAGETMALELRDRTGRVLAATVVAPAAGGTLGDVAGEIGSGLAGFGSFALDPDGRVSFAPSPGFEGASLVVRGDSTRRFGQLPLSGLLGLGTARGEDVIASAAVTLSGATAPAGRADPDAAIGEPAVGPGDVRAFQAIADALAAPVRLPGAAGVARPDSAAITLDRAIAETFGITAAAASDARARAEDLGARHDEAVRRRDSFAGVNVDEELAQMTLLQSSYAAIARTLTAARDMLDELLRASG